jgi:hypothetical protein
MRPTLTLLAALLALLLAAAPASAHHGKGSHARNSDSDHGAKSDNHGESAPGNSGWAHWCKEQHDPGRSRGQCIAESARSQGVEVDGDDDGEQGDLRITAIDVNEDGSFRVQGRGAEGSVAIWVGGGSGEVVGFGQGEADREGHFDIRGQWACQDDDNPHGARVHAQDEDERDSDPATFPCDEED